MSQDAKLLHPLLISPTELSKEARLRRSEYRFQSIHPSAEKSYIKDGWERHMMLKRVVKMKAPKPLDERLEDRFWNLMHRMGYPEMNQGRNFKIQITRPGADPQEKQIDVFAKDDETIIVAECKISQTLRRRSLQKDIEAFSNLKGPISKAIKKNYTSNYKPKILWMLVTENIVWSNSDKERAKRENIHVVRERELRYFSEIVNHLGPAARYQFLAEFLRGQKIPNLANRKVPAIRGKLGGRYFYCFVTTPRELLKISFVNHRSLRDPEGAPTYQRLVQKSRIKKIGQHIVGGGFFPTNLLINFTSKVRFDPSEKDEAAGIHYGHIYLPDKYQSAWIIDGQHRLYGYSGLDDKYLSENLLVMAFENMSKEEEANLFVTINHEQKTVPRTLLDELEGELKWGSSKPSERLGSISSRLIDNLKADQGEPFYEKVSEAGMRSGRQVPLTVPEFKKGILQSELLGKTELKGSVYVAGPLSGKNDYETVDRARHALNSYFTQIRDTAFLRWEAGREGGLCTNHGVQGFLKLLAALIEHFEKESKLDAKELEVEDLLAEIEGYLDPILLTIRDTTEDEYQSQFKVRYGSGGARDYFFQLVKIVRLKVPSLSPEGYEKWEEEQSEEKIHAADQHIKDLISSAINYVFKTLRERHGEKNNAYWEYGVKSTATKTRAYEKSQDVPLEERGPLETYLDFIELKKVVEDKDNWELFKSVFNIKHSDDPKGRAKYVLWMDKVNKLRRISAHPSSERSYKLEDFEYIEWIYGEFINRLKSVSQERS